MPKRSYLSTILAPGFRHGRARISVAQPGVFTAGLQRRLAANHGYQQCAKLLSGGHIAGIFDAAL
jgi:hypothetical protein